MPANRSSCRDFFSFFCFLAMLCLPTSAQSTVKRIAVYDFDSAGLRDRIERNWNVGRDISSRIDFELARNGTFEVVERGQLEKILREQNMFSTDRFDDKSAIKIGILAGASAVVIGTVNQFNIEVTSTRLGGLFGQKRSVATVELTARIVDTSTGTQIAAARGVGQAEQKGEVLKGEGRLNRELYAKGSEGYEETLLGKATALAVNQLVDELIESSDAVQEAVKEVKGVVVDVSDEAIGIDVGSNNGLMTGDIVHIVHIDKEIKSPTTGKVLYERFSKVAAIKLLEVGPDFAIGLLQEQPTRSIKEGDQVRLPKTGQ